MLGGSVANMGVISLCRRGLYIYIIYCFTCINVMSRRVVMVAHGPMG